jgi:hypothetical protein
MVSVESAGVQIALPSQTIFIASTSASTAGEEGMLKAPTPEKKITDLAAKSA